MVTKNFEYKGVTQYPSEDVSNVGYTKKELDERDIFHTKEKPNKVFVNFFDMESKYEKYKSIFLSKSLLHKHFKSNYTKQNQVKNTAPTSISILPPIIKSTVSTKVVGSEYIFRG